MAEILTPQQQMAVTDRGGKLLVSAAAGSGKTKVLVDRLLRYLLDPLQSANIDDFLIITYTKAAAAELRGKIAAKLSEQLAQTPENKHLQRQLQRLYLTKISTVHAFCADILREYAYRLDLSGDFRVADENECRELREKAMSQVLEEAYRDLTQNDDFRVFLDTQGLGRDDRLVPEILFKVYDSARCHLSPDQWLDACIKNADVSAIDDVGQTLWGKYLMEDLFDYLDLQIDALSRCMDAARLTPEMEGPVTLFAETVKQLQSLRAADSWDAIIQNKDIEYGTLRFSKKCTNVDLNERMKAVRNACKKGVAAKLKSFSTDSAQTLQDMHQCFASVRGMVGLVRRFDEVYSHLKQGRRALDFGDLEHQMLDLLLGVRRDQITSAATEIGERFREIMVDEYQDSNQVQDAIFSALTQKQQNCFMVGDVKQSIYQFRLADPGIFLEKYNAYVPAEEAKPGQGRKVFLSANFRSGGGVLECVNYIFSHVMTPSVGGLSYGEEEALREGVPHVALDEPEVELLVTQADNATYEEEAAVGAQRAAQLLDGKHFVRDGQSLRPIVPEDIVILLRSPGSIGSYYADALAKKGIRCTTGGGEDLLQTREIAVLRALLQVIGNPRQDIPLIAVLASPLFGFTADELALIRSKNRKCSIYDSLLLAQNEKTKNFLSCLENLRYAARMQPLSRLMEEIFAQTRIDSLFGAMVGGAVARENLQIFYGFAAEYEASSHGNLGKFLEFLDSIEDKGLVTTGEQSTAGAVTIMSIHKSKGLEFPVVFVAGLSREFNRESLRSQVLCDQTLGLGLSAVDEKNRVRYPTVAKRAIMVKTAADSLSEEMRVLYVALTRARDRLIMTYTAGNLEGDIQNIAARLDMSGMELLSRDAVCPGDWVIAAALQRTEAGALYALGGQPDCRQVSPLPWLIREVTNVSGDGKTVDAELPETSVDPEFQASLEKNLVFRYPYHSATLTPSKQTATQRKGRQKDSEVAEQAPAKQAKRHWRAPGEKKEIAGGADQGVAMHSFMQYVRYEACKSLAGVQNELDRMVSEERLTKEQAKWIDCHKVVAFFQTEIGKKLQSAQSVLREFKFSILDNADHYGDGLEGENILLQGVVDCAILESDGITVIDFKTDRVTEQTLGEKAAYYRPQVLAYAGALERIYGKRVKAAALYFFAMDQTVIL